MIKITLKIANIVKRIVASTSFNISRQMVLELKLFVLNWIYSRTERESATQMSGQH